MTEAVQVKMLQLRHCYDREREKQPALAGELVINLVVAPDGTLETQGVQRSTIGAEVESCVTQRLYKATFPAASERTFAGLTLVFDQG